MLRSPTTTASSPSLRASAFRPAFHFVEEFELVVELLIDRGIRLIATCRDIEIVQHEGMLAFDHSRNMAAIILAAERLGVRWFQKAMRETMATP